jgi:hypothetical protein
MTALGQCFIALCGANPSRFAHQGYRAPLGGSKGASMQAVQQNCVTSQAKGLDSHNASG